MSQLSSISLKINFYEPKHPSNSLQPLSTSWHFEITPIRALGVELSQHCENLSEFSSYIFEMRVSNKTEQEIILHNVIPKTKKGFELKEITELEEKEMLLKKEETVSLLIFVSPQNALIVA